MSESVPLTRSGWMAHDINHHGLLLSYEGKQFVRSQVVIRYKDGSVAYEWPEVVPPSVKAKVRDLLHEAHEDTKPPLQRLAEADYHQGNKR